MINEIKIPVRGKNIAAKVWNDHGGIPTLALHGWLDNAASFDNIAPLLPQCHIVALDLPGHGFSDHPSKSATLHMLDLAITTILVANELGWDKFALLGHSLGACINGIIAGTIRERLLWTVMIDALGPLTKPAELAPQQFRAFMTDLISKPNKKSPRYASFDDALHARLSANHMHAESAKILVKRGLMQLSDGHWSWRTDPRLLMPLAQLFTEEQVLAYLKDITAPVCLIKPDQGYPFGQEIINKRYEAVKNIHLYELHGQHHIHLDSPLPVAKAINTFLATHTK